MLPCFEILYWPPSEDNLILQFVEAEDVKLLVLTPIPAPAPTQHDVINECLRPTGANRSNGALILPE